MSFLVLRSPSVVAALVATFGAATAAVCQDVAPPHCHAEAAVDPNAPLPMDRKSVLLREHAEKLRNSNAPFFGEGTLRKLDVQIKGFNDQMSAADRAQAYLLRGDEELQFGMVEAAIKDYDAALALMTQPTGSKFVQQDPKVRVQTLRRLGMAWLRQGERSNCISNHNQDSCLLPLKDGALHLDRTGSEKAMEYFTQVLQEARGDVATMWLLNIAAMTLGKYPDGVPQRWRMPESAFKSERELPRMLDMAPKYGLGVYSNAGGSAMDDFNGDGRLDLLVSSMDVTHALRLYLQMPDRTFKNVAAEVGINGQLGGLQVGRFDANNDGRLDIMVLRGGWMGSAGEIPNSLLIQQPDGTFVDRTQEAGIEVAAPTQAACVADADNDGDLDLFIGHEAGNPRAGPRYFSRLYRNRGDGTFEDLSQQAGVENCGFVKGCAFGDYDGDRLPDLYVTTMKSGNLLFHNEGDFKFVEVGKKLGVNEPEDTFSAFFFDFNNDGLLDLYASCYEMGDRVGHYASYLRDGTPSSDVNRLYRNDGHGGFVDVTRQVRLNRVSYPMGSNFGDIDNDGFPDIYLATGAPDFQALFPNVMYRNDGGKRFEDVTAATGTGMLQKGHGVSFGDLDGDGDQDLYTETGGAFRDDKFSSILYENPGNENHWITVRLAGKRSNRFAVGARIKATIEEKVGESTASRTIYAFVGMNSSFGGNSLQEEMGMGQAIRITELQVYWPTTDVTQTFTDVPLDHVIAIEEDNPKLRAIDPNAAW